MNRLIAPLFFLLAVFATPVQAHTEPIVNFENQVIKRFDDKKLSMADVLTAIRNAAEKMDWRVEPNGPGRIIATLVVRNQHTAIINIVYNTESYSITYRDSINLDYSAQGAKPQIKEGKLVPPAATGVIHPNYNKWVQQFNDAIFRELQR